MWTIFKVFVEFETVLLLSYVLVLSRYTPRSGIAGSYGGFEWFALEMNRDHSAIQVYAPTSNAEEAELEQFYEDL